MHSCRVAVATLINKGSDRFVGRRYQPRLLNAAGVPPRGMGRGKMTCSTRHFPASGFEWNHQGRKRVQLSTRKTWILGHTASATGPWAMAAEAAVRNPEPGGHVKSPQSKDQSP